MSDFLRQYYLQKNAGATAVLDRQDSLTDVEKRLRSIAYAERPKGSYPSARAIDGDSQNSRMNLAERGVAQFANQAVLEDIEQARPSTTAARGIGMFQSVEKDLQGTAFDAGSDSSFLEQVRDLPRLWWSLVKGYYGESPAEAEAAIREARGDVTFDVPPAETVGEKVTDAGAGLAAFLARLVAIKKLTPAEIPASLRGAVTFELENAASGGIPGQGALMGGALQGIGNLPGKGLTGELGKMAAESALFAGTTAAFHPDADAVDILIAAAIPIGLRGASFARSDFRARLRAARTPDEVAQVIREANFFSEKHAEAQRFVENATPETLKKIRTRFEGRNDPEARGMIDLIDAKLRGDVAPNTQGPPTREQAVAEGLIEPKKPGDSNVKTEKSAATKEIIRPELEAIRDQPAETAQGPEKEVSAEKVVEAEKEKDVTSPSVQTADTLRTQIRAVAKSDEETDAAMALIEARAESAGETVGEYIGKRFAGVVRGGEPGVDALEQSAYHGSPHTFDKFSTEKIGTGEGAQSYGYGLYFAGKEAVARWYRDKFTRFSIGGKSDVEIDLPSGLDDIVKKIASGKSQSVRTLAKNELRDALVDNNKILEERISQYKKEEEVENENNRNRTWDTQPVELTQFRNSRPVPVKVWKSSDGHKVTYWSDEREFVIDGPNVQNGHADTLEKAQSFANQPHYSRSYNQHAAESVLARNNTVLEAIENDDIKQVAGRLYEVDLKPSDDEYLLWDAPLAQQSEKVKAALKGTEFAHWVDSWRADEASGRDLYSIISSSNTVVPAGMSATSTGARAAGSARLRSLGIRGIKYADGSSRGTYHLVVPPKPDQPFLVEDSLGKEVARGTEAEMKKFIDENTSYNYVIFDDSDVEILKMYQARKGSVEFLEDGRAIIRAFESSDVSTLVHEIGHVFRRDLEGDMLATAEQWAGVQDGKWTRDAEEKFARGWERYVRTGKAPTDALKRVFEQFREWLSKIYQKIKGSPIDVKITPKMRSVFDDLLTPKDARDARTISGDQTQTGARRNVGEAAEDVPLTRHGPYKKESTARGVAARMRGQQRTAEVEQISVNEWIVNASPKKETDQPVKRESIVAEKKFPKKALRDIIEEYWPGITEQVSMTQQRAEGGAADRAIVQAEIEGDDYALFIAHVFKMDKDGELKREDIGSLVGINTNDLKPGDTFEIDHETVDVLDATDDAVTLSMVTEEGGSIPIGGNEDMLIDATTTEFTIPRDSLIPANQGSVARAVADEQENNLEQSKSEQYEAATFTREQLDAMNSNELRDVARQVGLPEDTAELHRPLKSNQDKDMLRNVILGQQEINRVRAEDAEAGIPAMRLTDEQIKNPTAMMLEYELLRRLASGKEYGINGVLPIVRDLRVDFGNVSEATVLGIVKTLREDNALVTKNNRNVAGEGLQESLTAARDNVAPFIPGYAQESSGAFASPMRTLAAPAFKTTPVTTRIAPAPIAGGEVKQLSRITLDLSKSLGRTIRVGNPRVRKAGGAYYPGSADLVIRFAGDLDITAHEVAHALDDQFSLVAKWASPRTRSPFDAELIPHFSQFGSPADTLAHKRAEGVAEWIRAWIINPDQAVTAAPQFAQHFLDTVPENTMKVLEQFSQDVRQWAGLPASQQTLANIEIEPPSVFRRWKDNAERQGFKFTFGDKLKREVLDNLAPLWKGLEFARHLQGAEDALIPASQDAKVLIRLLAGFDTYYGQVLENGPVNARREHVKGLGGLPWLFEPADHTSKQALEDDLGKMYSYMVAERTIEEANSLREAVKQVKQWQTESLKAPTALEALLGRPASPEEIAARRQELQDQIRETMKRAGYDGAIDNFGSWVNHRVERLSGIGAGMKSDEVQAIETVNEIRKGDPEQLARVEELARRYRAWSDSFLQYAVDKGLKTQAWLDDLRARHQHYVSLQRVFEEFDPEGAKAMRGGKNLGSASEITYRFHGSTRTIQNPIISLLMQGKSIMREADRNEALRTFADEFAATRGMYQGTPLELAEVARKVSSDDRNAIKVMRDGEAEYWQFHNEINDVLKGLGSEGPSPLVWRIITLMPRVMRGAITHSPAFAVRNVQRDVEYRVIITDAESKLWDSAYMVNPKIYREMRRDLERYGGGMFGYYKPSRRAWYREMKRAMREGLPQNGIVALPGQIAELYPALLKWSESSGRAAEFRAEFTKAKEEFGWDDLDAGLYAAYQSRDLLDFAVAGRVVKLVNQAIPFTNAAIRGIHRTTQAIKDHPTRTLSRLAIYTFIPTALEMLWAAIGGDEDEWAQLPAYQKDFFWNFKVGPDFWIRIPKPFELGLPSSALGRAISGLRGHDNAFEGFFGSSRRAMIPIDESALLGPLQVLAEMMTNHDIFRDKAIIPPWEEGAKLELRDTSRASNVSKVLSEVIPSDPRMLDHFIEGQFGGLGRIATQSSNIGREDAPGARYLFMEAGGIFKSTPAYNAMDVQWLFEDARLNQKSQDQRMKRLGQYLEAYFDAKTATDRQRRADALRNYASKLRSQIEKNGW